MAERPAPSRPPAPRIPPRRPPPFMETMAIWKSEIWKFGNLRVQQWYSGFTFPHFQIPKFPNQRELEIHAQLCHHRALDDVAEDVLLDRLVGEVGALHRRREP